MERIMSVEEKIRRAEEIYQRRKQEEIGPVAKVSVNNKKDIKLLKKMVIQIIICIVIYLSVYTIRNKQYIFSDDFINKANEILSYDINFESLCNTIKNQFNKWIKLEDNQDNSAIGGAIEENEENEIDENRVQENDQNGENTENLQGNEQSTQNLSQTEIDVQNIKNTTTFVKPLEGIITSRYGQRDVERSSIPKDHTGVDIAANLGTKIKSSTDGEVVLASEEGGYGKHLKIQIGEVSIIYAHCNNLYVKQGDKISQGQEIAEVGSTGNSTGPHLHFEIRISERIINPELILQL